MKPHKKDKKHQGNAPHQPHFERSSQAREMHIDNAMRERKGSAVIISGIVDSVQQTPGPTVFTVFDGTGTLALKSFVGPGARAHPEIVEGDAVRAHIEISEFRDMIEGEIDSLLKLIGPEKEAIIKKIQETERKRAEIPPVEFMVKSPILDKSRDRFIKAATEIRLAIFQNRPIIVRHHNDTDGYSAGFTLERAILPLIETQHGGGKSAWEFYTRAPCAAPFYEIDDSIRDTATSLRNQAKFSNKMPLVIIADNGSSQEDLMGIRQGKVHGISFIVVDHHFFEKDVISDEVLVHINPFLVGEDGAKFSAGMLCAELARFINPKVSNIEQIPAMAGLADRINNPEVMDAYIAIAEKQGYTKELLNNISTVIDFISSKLRFMEAREYIEVLFGEPRTQQKSLVELLAPHIRRLEAKGLEIAKSAVKVEKVGPVTLQLLEIEATFSRGFYPKPGKCTGLMHDEAQTHGVTALVSAGVLNDAITIRATDAANFSVHKLIEHLHKTIPTAYVEGGGHKNAGAISFIPSKRDEILKQFREFIKHENK